MFRELDVGQSALLTDLAMCVYYRLFSPGLYCCVHATFQLDDGTRFCQGIVVQVNHRQLKRCDPEPSYDCFKGPPNVVLDVFPAGANAPGAGKGVKKVSGTSFDAALL